MATARQNVHDALAPLRTFPIGPVNGSQIRSIGLAVEAAIVAGLAGDTEDPEPVAEEPAKPTEAKVDAYTKADTKNLFG